MFRKTVRGPFFWDINGGGKADNTGDGVDSSGILVLHQVYPS